MNEVKIWEEDVIIPTYDIGQPDKNPMFLEKRVYQGSSGKVYPYPTIDTISPVKEDKVWRAVYLENEYIKVMLLPALGGRIQRAYDKTNQYDFVYYNQVIKPALVGLLGPWISGGIEFNWPQHHRPTTYMPVNYLLQENEDGSKSLLIHDVDQMYGTKCLAKFTLYPGKAYIEIEGQLYNGTSLPQTFLWWANPAVAVNDHTQSVFPPSIHNVYDHGKRDVSRFPIAKGVYYKHDYSEGVDISRYKNIPVPTSYMAESSNYDFVGGYDHQKEAGLLHVADHHISPGKKQWTWGCGDFGQAWDRNLTDEDGPYIELMTGVYTENQPDFTWLKPFEEKKFKQYFMPYKKVGMVKNATTKACVNLEETAEGIHVIAYGTERYEQATILLTCKDAIVKKETVTLSPVDIFETTVPMNDTNLHDWCIDLYADGMLLVSYQPEEPSEPSFASPAEAAKMPEEIKTNEELLLTAQHIEQHRHATYLPDPYYLEGLKRDPGDIRINNAYGTLLLRRGLFAKAETYFRAAIKRLTWRSPNPYDGESYYNLGLSLFYQKKYDSAFDAFYKAIWSSEQQEKSYYYLASIASLRGDYEAALELVEKGLVKNMHNIKARGLKACLLRKLNCMEKAQAFLTESFAIDAFDYMAMFEEIFACGDEEKKESLLETLRSRSLDSHDNYLRIARDYGESGFFEEAIFVLNACKHDYPLLNYYKGYYYALLGNASMAMEEFAKAEHCDAYCCFPNKLEDIAVLETAISMDGHASKAPYYLGCLYYDKLQFDKAISLWERSISIKDDFATVHRNLAIAAYNKEKNPEKAMAELSKAFSLDEGDARIFLELDQLHKKVGTSFEERLARFDAYPALMEARDDLMLEYITLHNLLGRHQEAYDLIMSHTFRPWEGAEGKISSQYKIALVEMAKAALAKGALEEAEALLQKALVYPSNLGEGKLEGTKDNHIYYYLGFIAKARCDEASKAAYLALACLGENEPAGVLYYYDQPADMILYKGLASLEAGDSKAAYACFNKLMDYGERHLHDEPKDDFFAVSLPDFLIFDDDMKKKNQAHCHYLMGLAHLGMKEYSQAVESFDKAISYDYNHQNARIYKSMCK